jgi:ATP phosphoribosyltransferase
MSLLIAFPKGRLGDELLTRIAGTELAPASKPGRSLKVAAQAAGVEIVFLKGSDLVEYVARNVAALGVVGSDSLDEHSSDVLELADLGIGKCRLSLSAPLGITTEALQRRRHLKIATKFYRSTSAWLERRAMTAELVHLTSSIELAPVLGLADAIVDLVQTGQTLRENGLVELEELHHTSGRIIASRGAYLEHGPRLEHFCKVLREACASSI